MSELVEDDDVRAADLVLTMTREHAREIIVMDPGARDRTFTFKEIVRRGEAAPRGDEPLSAWLARLASRRGPQDLLGSSPLDDVADPVGLPLSAHRTTLVLLDDLADRFVRVAWPPAVARVG